MPVYLVSGQDDISLEVGDVGDKTVTVDIAASSTHVILKNLDARQSVMYALAYPAPPPPPPVIPQRPVFPDDWNRLDPKKEVMFPIGTIAKIHLRKLTYIRGEFAINDVPVKVQVGETAQAV